LKRGSAAYERPYWRDKICLLETIDRFPRLALARSKIRTNSGSEHLKMNDLWKIGNSDPVIVVYSNPGSGFAWATV
jgi:hypothetical protein